MTSNHDFLLEKGQWLGEGTISFSESPESLPIFIRWTIDHRGDGTIACRQEVEIEGVPEKMSNEYEISKTTPTSFAILLSNPLLGNIPGTGIIDDHLVAWEFREAGTDGTFGGFETYKRQSDGTYQMHAEYSSTSQMRTTVKGSIWKKAQPSEKLDD